jgi:hypothetical protein
VSDSAEVRRRLVLVMDSIGRPVDFAVRISTVGTEACILQQIFLPP